MVLDYYKNLADCNAISFMQFILFFNFNGNFYASTGIKNEPECERAMFT